MLFMGQEFGASSPFCFFTDHKADLAAPVHEGRKKFLAQFPSYATPEAQARVPAPNDPSTFERSKLDFAERERHAPFYRFHEALLRLRREDPLVARQDRRRLDGAVLGDSALCVRYFGEGGDDRLLLANWGLDLEYDPGPEPLLAPPHGREWRLVFSSDDARYGGPGAVNPCDEEGCWRLPGGSASFFAAVPSSRGPETAWQKGAP